MTAFSELINTIHSSLHSYTGAQEQSTYLTGAITNSALSVAVNSTDQMNRGIVEIDSELLLVDVADSNVLTIPPFGRGYRGSTAASHLINTQVTFDPAFPRVEIKKALVQAIQRLYPALYQIKTVDLTYSALPIGYSLPADCKGVLAVKTQPPSDPFDYWQPVYEWAFDPESPEATSNALNIFGAIVPGSTVRVVYKADFSAFADASAISTLVTDATKEANDISTLGLAESWIDLLQYSVAAQMVRFLDPARLQLGTVENMSRSQVVQVADGGKVANQLFALYQQRLAEERRELLTNSPTQINFQR